MSTIALGSPPLVKNRAGKYEIRFSEKLENGDWRSRTVSTRTASKPAAQTFLKEWLEAEQTAVKKATGQDIGAIIDRYLRARTNDAEKWALKPVKVFFKDYLPQNIDDDVIAEYRAEKKHLKDGTVRRQLASLVAAMNFSAKHKHIKRDDIPQIELPSQSPRKELFLDENQDTEFHAFAMGDSIGEKRLTRVTRFVAIALDTASRKGAIETLTWDRVNLQSGLIDFHVTGEKITNKRRVKVPIADRLMPVLERAYKERISEFVIDEGAIRKSYDTFRDRTPHPWVTPHVMRHTWATLAARAGVALWDIAGVLGDNEATVRKHYLHHCPEHLRGAVNRRNF